MIAECGCLVTRSEIVPCSEHLLPDNATGDAIRESGQWKDDLLTEARNAQGMLNRPERIKRAVKLLATN